MRKQVTIIILLSLLLLPTVLATDSSKTVDSEMQKLTHFAKEYEVGNIDYAQLMIYVSSARESLNEIVGVTNRDMGGIVKQEQIKKVLGEPVETTKWVWVEGEDHDKKLDKEVPVWRKIVFDGKRIQIRMEAYPSIFTKKKFGDDNEDKRVSKEEIEEGSIIYRLHFNTQFKRPQDELNIEAKIEEIKSLAEDFNENPTSSNAETLAKQSVNAERIFQNYFQQGQGKCEDIMKKIFGSENQRQTQKVQSNEFTFQEGENFEAIMRLEMCDECEYNYVNLNMWVERRGKFEKQEEEKIDDPRKDEQRYMQMSDSEIKSEVKKILEEIKSALEAEEFNKAQRTSQKLNSLNNVWSQQSNNVWEEVKKTFEEKINAMSEKERYEFDQSYGWIKQDQEQRQAVKALQDEKYEERKQFYLDLFSDYDMKELYFTQTDFEKRLIEEFKEKGEEVCNNNKDDNEDGQTDCADSQCGGKICGAGTQTITDGNTTSEVSVDFYCIQSICQAKEETNESTEPVCGNHVCEEGESDNTEENGTCQSDCDFAQCPVYDAIECSGTVIFEGEDENGCSLQPICIEETQTCETSEDCSQPSCGIAECIQENGEGTCKVTELTGCTAECESWEQEIESCNNQKIITKICEDGSWKETGSKCESSSDLSCVQCGSGCITKEDSMVADCQQPTEDFKCVAENGACKVVKQDLPEPVPTDPIVGHECTVASDCGGEDDICSNGKCVQLPKVIRTEEPKEKHKEEQQEEPKEEPKEEQQEEPKEESNNNPVEEATFGIFKSLFSRFTIFGSVTAEEGESTELESPSQDNNPNEDNEPESNQDEPSNQEKEQDNFDDSSNYNNDYQDNNNDNFQDNNNEWEEKNKEEEKQREKENKERCQKDCVRPCIDKCTREACGENMDCDIEKEIKSCESSCQPEDSCIEKCTAGEQDWWKEFEDKDMKKQEKGVFQVGGGCRQEKGTTNGYIWFGGWGDPFEQVQSLKEKYYTGGDADWCKQDLNNLVKQREEFENSFNQEFAQWFFEKYLPNSAEEWEQAQNGIYELYWNSVDTQRQLAERMQCVGKNDINDIMNPKLINLTYETEFGRLEYWEEVGEVKMDWMEQEVTVISPYMKVWIFPSVDFIKYEMKSSMENGEFPGSPEEKSQRKNEEGLTEEEKIKIKEDEKMMKLISNIADEYNGNANIALQIVDAEEVIFNLHIQVNEEDIMIIEPKLPEENPATDITVQMDFQKLYELINFEQKEMSGERTESPPWDQKKREGGFKGFTDGIKMYFKVRSLINSAEVTPSSAKGDVKKLMNAFIKMGGKDDQGKGMSEDEMIKESEAEGEGQKGQSSLTGKVTEPAFKF